MRPPLLLDRGREMSIPPHEIVAGMTSVENVLGGNVSKYFEPGVWRSVKAAISTTAVDFDFGDAVPVIAHMEFANGLLDRGLFRLPFNEVLFRGRAMPHGAVLAQQQPDSKYHLLCTSIGPVQTPGGEFKAWGPLLTLGLRGDRLDAMTVDWKSCTVGGHHSRKTGKPWAADVYDEKTEMILNWVCGLTAMLMSKDVEVSTETPSPRLNKDRIAKGKPPIRERRVIKISPQARAEQAAALDDLKAGRRSPVIHWRRGHFRELSAPRKRDGATVIPIAPVIVGARDGAEQPKVKGYQII